MASKSYTKFFCFKQYEKNTKGRVIKNYLAFSSSFLLLFASSNGVVAIQSLLNPVGYIGIISQILLIAIQIPFSITVPTIIIETIGFKYSMLAVEIGYFIYIASNAYPTYYTLIPGKHKQHVWL